MFQGDIPTVWDVDESSDMELATEGDCIVLTHKNADITASVTAVKEKSYRLDFLGEVVTDDGEELESLWLASDDYPTVSHTREEILKWLTEQLKAYETYE